MDRRHFLRHAAAGLAAAPLAATHATLLAVPRAPARLLVVFLRGAYDAASLLVPVGIDFYYEARPQLAVPRPGSGPDAALPLAGGWGLHPALADSMAPLYARGELAFVPFAGTDDTSRSHFETQDRIELGQPLAGNRDYRSGFLNRLAAVLHPAPGPQARDAIAFTDQVPLVLRGGVEVPNLSLAALPGRPALDDRQSGLVSAMYAATPLAESVRDGFAVRADATRALQDEMQAASRDAIGAKGFEGEARRMARLMQDRYRLGFVDVGGWDTHVGQGQGGRGYLADRLGALGRGLAAYADGMGAAWRDTAVVVISEFGRTFRENGSRGTDHGHGSVYWVLGGAVRGGRIAGEQVAVVPQALFQNRDYPVLNDYRSVLGGLFARLYGLSPAQVQQVFPAAAPRDLGLA